MAARFPQSGSSVAYKIKDAWASKIHVLYWAAGANSVHRLRSGDTSSTIITRTAGSATFNSTDGRISGNATGMSTSTYFTDNNGATAYGGLTDGDPHTVIFGVYGSIYSDIPAHTTIFACESVNVFLDGFRAAAPNGAYTGQMGFKGGAPRAAGFLGASTPALYTIAARVDSADATADQRAWANGSEYTAFQSGSVISGTGGIGTSSRPFYFGGSYYGSATSQLEWEFCAFGDALSDADMATITSDPASIIEEVAASATITLTDPVAVVTGGTGTCTITRNTAASGTITYNLTSSATGVATVPATATIADGQTTGTFNVTGVSAGSATITATNAADSGETDTATANVSALKGLELSYGQVSATGLDWAWFDSTDPATWGAPSVKGSAESTDGSGLLTITLTGTTLNVGQQGMLVVWKEGATRPDDIGYIGIETVADIG